MNKILMGAFGAVVVSVGGIVAESIRELAMESTNNRIAREIANAVADAVAYVSQVYVDGLKLAGSFDEEAQKQALSMALAACLSSLSASAQKYIEKTDKYRGDFYRYHTGHEWADARNYDLCLNSGKLGFQKCVEEIKSYMKIRFDME